MPPPFETAKLKALGAVVAPTTTFFTFSWEGAGGGGASACLVFVIVHVGTLDCGLESTTLEQPE